MDLDDEELKATRKLLGLDKGIEEDIGTVEKFIKQYEETQEKYKDDEIQAEIERSCYFEEVPYKEIKNLLQDYERQKQRNEEHQKINGELREKVKELEIDLTTVYIKGVEDGKEKYKQKIKDEIEELKKIIDKIKNDEEYSNEIPLYNHDIEILQELLKESEEK